MNNKQKFPLSYVTLYAKGWYQKSDNLEEDLIKILKLENYTAFDLFDVYRILLKFYNKSFKIDLFDFISDIDVNNCWKIAYYPKNYNLYEAVIHKILSDLRMLDNTEWDVKTPKYTKELKRKNTVSINQIYNQFCKNLKK